MIGVLRAAPPSNAASRPGATRTARARARTAQPWTRAPLIAALAGFTALYGAVRANRSAAFDLAVSVKVQGWRSPLFQRLMAAASWPGFPPQSRIIPPLIIGTWAVSGRPLEAGFQAAAWGTATLSTIVKAGVRRPRPLPPAVRVVVAPLGGTSFPSGHVLTYVGFYGFLAHLLWLHLEPGPARNATLASLLALLALVGVSRIEEGHHWATDVIASYLLGTAYLLVLFELYRRVSAR